MNFSSNSRHAKCIPKGRQNIKDQCFLQRNFTNTVNEETVSWISIFKGAGGPEDWGHARLKMHGDGF